MDDAAQDPVHSLISEARNGNYEAFRQIVLRYSNALLSVAYSVIGDFHEAQDATQEAFVKSYRQLHTLSDPSKLGSWLYAIVYRTSLDFARKKKRLAPLEDVMSSSVNPVEAWLDLRMTREAVWNAIQSLEHKSKSAIVLHYVSEWSMKEIGRFLNLSLSAVESRIRRARELLKRQLAEDFEPYFRAQRLDRTFEQKVMERLLRSMGHFYIPVLHRERTQDWFIRHFRLGISRHGNLLIASGHELYLLECQTHRPSEYPLMAFEVPDVNELWFTLQHGDVRTEPLVTDEWMGEHFVFADPDENLYHAIEKKSSARDGFETKESSIYRKSN
ncbi:sigma-70 family RNA polymerase sigma factor [Cohnella panacarvi]|uniref:sigma-70 family RNA polymerase sigma factor n=1 Tax=Cohnella panacarvi TaxID=400776 RepID=UPI00047EB17E|nr:sigma-70 family RNA polymerase sigma factor [Cohnella panacarvi]